MREIDETTANLFDHLDALRIIGEDRAAKKYIYSFLVPEDSDEYWFPDPRMASGNDPDMTLLCYGPELTEESVSLSYEYGIFPWFGYQDADMPRWHAPLDRFVLFPEEIHVSHSMRTLLNSRRYKVSFNKAFPEVIEACRTVDGRDKMDGAWLSNDIKEIYSRLSEKGRAGSVEVWDTRDGDRLVGGLYGIITDNGNFIGESMFSRVPSASKVALIALARKMAEESGNKRLIDLQIETPHLKSMGGRHIGYYDYLSIINPEKARMIDPEFILPFRLHKEGRQPAIEITDLTPKLLRIVAPRPRKYEE